MKFQDLPHDVQVIAAQTLRAQILESSSVIKKEPATKLAQLDSNGEFVEVFN